jgi:hypothetical protein
MSNEGKSRRFKNLRRVMLISWPFFLAILVFLGTRIALRNPELVENYYSGGVYPYIGKFLSWISNIIPFSLWDLFWIAFILMIPGGIALMAFKKIKPGRYFLLLAQMIALLYSLFYVTWGFNYYRSGLEVRSGWEKPKAREKAFVSILDTLIAKTNSCYTSVSRSDYGNIDSLIGDSYHKNGELIKISYRGGRIRPKKMIFSSFFAKAGVNGYFGPFFNEINLNYYVYPLEYPFALAHEKAHQIGIASEAEANFTSFVINTSSSDKRLQYSGYFHMLIYFLSDARQLKDYREYVKKIDKGVISDLQKRRIYYEGLQKEKLHKVQVAANDIYLKTNSIHQGIKNYDQVVALVIDWYNNNNINQGGKDR